MGQARLRVVERDYVAAAQQYIADVLAGVIPACKWVKLACERQNKDLKKYAGKSAKFFFDEEKANRVCKFIELLPHVKGPLAGQLIRLEPWQCFALTTAFGWVIRATGKRRFRRVYIEVPRGNAKSTLSSGVALYCLTADGEDGAEVYSVATTADQARIVFGDARQMALKTPGLRKNFNVEVYAHSVVVPRTGSAFKALSAEGSTLDGLNTHLGCIDELHAHKTRAVYDVIETSTGKRDQSLLWVITTAGSNRAGICYEVRGFVTKLLESVLEDDQQFGIIYTIDDTDDWTTEEALRKANPNWGVSVMPDIVGSLQTKALQMPSAAANFKTKHLCVWVNADQAWMDMRAWDACADHTISEEQFAGMECDVALDLATKVDIASRVKVFKKDDKFYVFDTHYLPEETAMRAENSQYMGWVRQGHLQVTPGEVIDFDAIENDLRFDAKRFRFKSVAYDPWQATQLASHMLAEKMPMVEVRQTVANMSEPMKQVQALVLQRKLVHNGNPVLTWMISNVVAHLDAKDNIYPKKERPENKIDGVVALIMAIGRAISQTKVDTPSPFIVAL